MVGSQFLHDQRLISKPTNALLLQLHAKRLIIIVIENRLESREPTRAFRFYIAMKKNKISRHETIHCMATIRTYSMHYVFEGIAEFAMEKYKSLLKRHKDNKPDKISSSLKRKFGTP
jgi:hypothetical protein